MAILNTDQGDINFKGDLPPIFVEKYPEANRLPTEKPHFEMADLYIPGIEKCPRFNDPNLVLEKLNGLCDVMWSLINYEAPDYWPNFIIDESILQVKDVYEKRFYNNPDTICDLKNVYRVLKNPYDRYFGCRDLPYTFFILILGSNTLITKNLIKVLAEYFKGKNILSVFSWNGCIEGLLQREGINIKATTKFFPKYYTNDPEMGTYRPWTNVEEIGAVEAVDKYWDWLDMVFVPWAPKAGGDGTTDYDVYNKIIEINNEKRNKAGLPPVDMLCLCDYNNAGSYELLVRCDKSFNKNNPDIGQYSLVEPVKVLNDAISSHYYNFHDRFFLYKVSKYHLYNKTLAT